MKLTSVLEERLVEGYHASLSACRRARARRTAGHEIAHLREFLTRKSVVPESVVEAARRFCLEWFGWADLRWHRIYWAMNGRLEPTYVPTDAFFAVVEPRFNPPELIAALADKTLAYSLPIGPHLPEPVLHVARGQAFDADFNPVDGNRLEALLSGVEEPLVVKPSAPAATGGGRNVRVLHPAEVLRLVREETAKRGRDKMAANFLVQRRLLQCEETARFNRSSANGIRALTLRTQSGLRHLSSVFRTGRRTSVVDNHAAGGVACGIGPDGELAPWGFDRNLQRYERHPDSGVAFGGVVLPGYSRVIDLCLDLHRKLPHLDLVSWDMVIDAEHHVRLFELNARGQDVDLHQIANGPLFGGPDSPLLSEALARLRL